MQLKWRADNRMHISTAHTHTRTPTSTRLHTLTPSNLSQIVWVYGSGGIRVCVNKCEYVWVLNEGGLRERVCVRERESQREREWSKRSFSIHLLRARSCNDILIYSGGVWSQQWGSVFRDQPSTATKFVAGPSLEKKHISATISDTIRIFKKTKHNNHHFWAA